jgi:5-methylcytosine-specific restriction endonuclease McrA
MSKGSKPSRSRKMVVWKRDEWACVYCGVGVVDVLDNPPRGITATVDHVVPRSKGGSHKITNLVTACWNCNKKRADKGAGYTKRTRQEVTAFSALADRLRAASA